MPQPSSTNNTATPVLFVVDDDQSMREALVDLFSSIGIKATAFSSTATFLESADLNQPGCILLDVRLPGLSGLDLQTQLERSGSKMPIVFMTGFGDVPMSVKAMKAGASDFLQKPFRDQDVIDAVTSAFIADATRWQAMVANNAVFVLSQTLTAREREVMHLVVKGLMNKQIAHQLGISEITVKLHRGNVMRKMEVRSLADLVRAVELVSSR